MNSINKLAVLVAGVTLYGTCAAADDTDKARCLAYQDISQAEACLRATDHSLGRLTLGQSGEYEIRETPSSIIGDYAEFFDGDLTAIRSPLLIKALENDGKALVVRVGAPDPVTGEYAVKLSTKDDGQKNYRGAILASNHGSEITGKEILSWYNRARLGNGYAFVSSLTHGISDLREVSKGGKYEAAFFGLEKASSLGLFEVQYLYSLNEPGGESKIYELAGETNRLSIASTHWLTPGLSVNNQLSFTHKKQDFGAFNLTESQNYGMYRPKATYSNGSSSASLTISKGLGGKQDYNLIPLMGTFNPDFWSAQLDGSTRIILDDGVGVSLNLSAFSGSQDMPASERFRLGGEGAGSSHENGIFSGYEGFSYDISMMKNLGSYYGVHMSGKAGFNGAKVTTATDHKLAINAFQTGLSARYGNFSLDAAWSKSVSTREIDADSRITLDLAWHY